MQQQYPPPDMTQPPPTNPNNISAPSSTTNITTADPHHISKYDAWQLKMSQLMQPKPHPLPLTDIQKKTLRHLDTATEMISNKVMEQIEKNKILTANPFSSSTAASSSLLGTPPPMKKSKRDGKRGSREGGRIDVVSVSFDVCFVYVLVLVREGIMRRVWGI